MTAPARKKPRGRPATGTTYPVQVRMPERMVAAIDKWMEGALTIENRPEAVRRLVEIALKSEGVIS